VVGGRVPRRHGPGATVVAAVQARDAAGDAVTVGWDPAHAAALRAEDSFAARVWARSISRDGVEPAPLGGAPEGRGVGRPAAAQRRSGPGNQ
jgi:hypothetical protein